MASINSNSTNLAGEFAVLSRLALEGIDANMTLGNTKGVDILLSIPDNGRMLKLEVKTQKGEKGSGGNRAEFGDYNFSWMMSKKHEQLRAENLFYCFVHISGDKKNFRFFIVPSEVVADYVIGEHKHWREQKRTRKANDMRTFRVGQSQKSYPIPTPAVEKYEDNWSFERK